VKQQSDVDFKLLIQQVHGKKLLKKKIKMIKYPLFSRLFRTYRDPSGKLGQLKRRFAAYHISLLHHENRSRGHQRLVLIVAGYKNTLWDIILTRIAKHTPLETDVCVVCPGKRDSRLEKICSENEWSILCTRENQLALASNIAIKEHPQAEFIHKLDEDIVVSDHYFLEIESTYHYVKSIDEYEIGFVAPTLNVNGFCYRKFLDFINPQLKNCYLLEFGDFRSSCMNTSAWSNPDAAKFLWNNSLPFDKTSEKFLSRPQGFDICHHRFSIGAIFFHRKTWKEFGYFSRAGEGELGAEEADLCAFCCDTSKAMLVAHRVFAGHVGFGPQSKLMIPWFKKNFC